MNIQTTSYSMLFNIKNIDEFAEDKKELEIKLITNKFNI